MCPARFARGGRCTSLLICLAKPQNKNLSLFTCFHLKTNKKKPYATENSDLPNTSLSSMQLRSVGAQNRFLASGQRGHSCPCGMGMGRCPCSPGMGRMGWPPNIPGSAWFWELNNPDWHYGHVLGEPTCPKSRDLALLMAWAYFFRLPLEAVRAGGIASGVGRGFQTVSIRHLRQTVDGTNF